MAKEPDVGEEKVEDASASNDPSGDAQDTSNQDSPTVEDLTQKIDSLTTQFEEAKTSAQTDLNQQKSALQSTHAAEIRDLRSVNDEQISALEGQVRQAMAASLDDDDREAYEKAWAAEDKGKLESQIETLKNERDMALSMGQYVQAANQLGIDPAKIDTTDPERAYQSMWSGVTELISDLKANNEELTKRAGQPVTPEDKPPASKPDQVLTTQHSTPSGKATLGDVRKALADELGRPNLTFDEVFNMAEERPDLEQKLRELE